MCLHAKEYTSKYSANYVLGVCRRLLASAPLAGPHLTCVNVPPDRWLKSALREDPAGSLRAMELALAEHPSEHTRICCTQQRAVATVRRMAEDPIAAFLQKADIMLRITKRAVRTQRLGEWALLRQVNADGSSRDRDVQKFLPDKGSSLALDDAGFMPDLSERLVCSTARFPVMNACENLVGAAQVHATALQEKRIRTASVAALCRSAIESSAKTIWLLSDTSREVRRAKCLGYTEKERSYQQAFDTIEEAILNKRTDPAKATDHQAFLRHRARYQRRLNAITSLPETARIRPTKRFEKIVKSSAEWIDANQL